ncbi:MAG: HAD family hydrolase [Pseudomonadota bacterium]|nr:HAD family hydrolase [Pseudomonadota bacterium]
MDSIQNYALVIFDCDGVLVDSELIANKVLAQALTNEGYHCTFQESILRFVGLDLKTIQRQVEQKLGKKLSRGFNDALRIETTRVFQKELDPVVGIESALAGIHFPKCVASSGTREKIHLCLNLTGLSDYFPDTRIFSAEQVPRGKPAPDLFLHAAAKMHANPSDCVVIEDSIPGVIAARAAGMSVFGFAGGKHASSQHPALLAKVGAVVFDCMATLPNHLKHVNPEKMKGSFL